MKTKPKKKQYKISESDKRILRLVKLAGEIVLKEDKQLLKELAKY